MSILSRARALGAIAAFGSAMPLALRAGVAAPKADPNDVRLLAAAAALERAAVKVYTDALATNALSAGPATVVNRFLTDHAAHRDTLVTALQAANAAPSSDVAPLDVPSLRTESDVLAYAYTLERLVSTTYLNSIGQYKNRDYATTAASILGVDAGHVALLAEALRRSPAYPTGFVTP